MGWDGNLRAHGENSSEKNLWKLRGAHSNQGICCNIAPLNFQRNVAKPSHLILMPPLIIFGNERAPFEN